MVVNVLDINDCRPTFTQPFYDEGVLENLPAGVAVTTVTASDCDTGNNAVVRYTIVAGDLSVFELDCELIMQLYYFHSTLAQFFLYTVISGEITTLAVLDYEMVSSYYLRVRATDMGGPTPLYSKHSHYKDNYMAVSLLYIIMCLASILTSQGEVDVNIQVMDFNDCPPEFVEPPPSYTIPEDAAPGSVLVGFTVSDCDGGLNGVNGSRFSIIAGIMNA